MSVVESRLAGLCLEHSPSREPRWSDDRGQAPVMPVVARHWSAVDRGLWDPKCHARVLPPTGARPFVELSSVKRADRRPPADRRGWKDWVLRGGTRQTLPDGVGPRNPSRLSVRLTNAASLDWQKNRNS